MAKPDQHRKLLLILSTLCPGKLGLSPTVRLIVPAAVPSYGYKGFSLLIYFCRCHTDANKPIFAMHVVPGRGVVQEEPSRHQVAFSSPPSGDSRHSNAFGKPHPIFLCSFLSDVCLLPAARHAGRILKP